MNKSIENIAKINFEVANVMEQQAMVIDNIFAGKSSIGFSYLLEDGIFEDVQQIQQPEQNDFKIIIKNFIDKYRR